MTQLSLGVWALDPGSEAVEHGVVLLGMQISKCFGGYFLRVNT